MNRVLVNLIKNAHESGSPAGEVQVAIRRLPEDWRIDVLNLLDSTDDDITYWYASRLPGEPAEGVEDYHFHPLEPRNVRLYVTWKY